MTVGKLLQSSNIIPQDVMNRTYKSAVEACRFMQAGDAITDWNEFKPADLWLISCPDIAIEEVAKQLSLAQVLTTDTVVFHCSGSLSSQILKPLDTVPYHACSIHPIHTFSDPNKSCGIFSGTHCAYEGDIAALNILIPAFEKLGAQLFEINQANKTLYHTGSVLACNALVGLLDASLECLTAAGVKQDKAQEILMPIVQQTVDNTLLKTPAQALTGPVSRGDVAIVTQQLEALNKLDPNILDIYSDLSLRILKLAVGNGLTPDAQQQLFKLLNRKT